MRPGTLKLETLDRAYVCVVELDIELPRPDRAGQMIRPLQQVTLRPEKVKGSLIRLGETMGDEALCWIRPEHVTVIEVLGAGVERDGKWECVPLIGDERLAA